MMTSSHNPDVVFPDLGLPDMDGIEVIKQIRGWSNMPVIFISARRDDADKIEALDAGADDYLTKPFSVEELLARLRVTVRRLALMKNDTSSDSSVYTNGKLRIDYYAGFSALYPDTHRYRLQDAEGGLKFFSKKCLTFKF